MNMTEITALVSMLAAVGSLLLQVYDHIKKD